MLKVRTYVDISPGRGFGLFADQTIQAGTTTWAYDAEFDASFTQDQVGRLAGFAKAHFLKYAYFDHDLNLFIMPFDDLRFINHAEVDFNLKSSPETDVATRLIMKGEELLCNYVDYEVGYFERRNLDRSKWV